MSLRVLVGSVCAMLVIVAFFSGASVGSPSAYGWNAATAIDICEDGEAWWPAIASDKDGNAIVVWQQDNGTYSTIWSNRFVFGTGWTGSVRISDNTLENAWDPQIDLDDEGNAIVVWAQGDLVPEVIFANRYVRGIGWVGPETISSEASGPALRPDVVCDSHGNAFSAWIQMGQIFASRYTLGQGWGTPVIVGPDYYYNAQAPSIDSNDEGSAIVTWADNTSETYNIWSNRYTSASGWGTQVIIQADDSEWAMNPDVAIDQMGNAIVVWGQFDGSQPSGHLAHAWANRYDADVGWGTARLLETDTTHFAGDPRVGMDGSGNAVVVWSQTAENDVSVWTARYSVSSGWGVAEWVPEADGVEPDLAVNDIGQAIIVWRFGGIYSNVYSPDSGWSGKETVSPTLNGTQGPVVSIDCDGDAVAAWMEIDGSFHSVYANQYVSPLLAIVVDSPEDGQTTDQPVVLVSGTTRPYATLSVNGISVVVESDGSFSCTIALVEGLNTIAAVATDSTGNSATVSVNVTYMNPVTDLREELNNTIDELVSLWDELNSTQEELAATEDELDATQEELDDLGNELSVTREDLNAAEEELRSTSDDLDGVKSQNLLLMAVLAAFATLAVVMSVMFFILRKKIVEMSSNPTEGEESPPPQS